LVPLDVIYGSNLGEFGDGADDGYGDALAMAVAMAVV
jgi:hypothetical protein